MKAKKKTISDLNGIYEKANQVDSQLFSEQRSNILLVAGDHYTKKNSLFWSRVRDNVQLSEEQRLRLTKNHTHKIANTYINNIFSLAPGVTCMPKNEKELQDQKSAELNNAVWEDWKQQNNYREQVRKDVEDFVKVGEVCSKIYWDPNAGEFIGYEQKIDPNTGMPAMDEMGRPVEDEDKPRFKGKICYERYHGFNVLREASTKDDISEGIVILRKMVDKAVLEQAYNQDEEKKKYIQPSSESVFTVFDGSSGTYNNTKDQILVKEFYQPPGPECPLGYFWIATSAGILEQGELPFGLWPIIFTGMDDIPTTPRKRSIIKVTRPFQAEINRTASKIAETQIAFDDKLLVMAGSKVTQAAKLPGIRVVNYTGNAPVIMEGKSGEQYLNYMNGQIAEMYQAANLEEENLDKTTQSTDNIAELLKVARHKKKFSLYAEKMEHYQVKKCELVLKLAKEYYDDSHIIPAIGRHEIVNIAEFKNTSPLFHKIKLEPSSDDYETKFGKHITFMSILQYAGGKLEKDDIGKIIRAAPYTNNERSFDTFTLDEDIATNMVLALDRGEYPKSNINYDHKFIIKRLAKRQSEPDFQFLPPQVQQAYEQKILEHDQMEAAFLLNMKRAQDEMIPATGPLVKVDMYVDDMSNPGSSQRAKMPIDALRWLEKRMQEQGIELKELEKIQDAQVSQMATQFMDGLGNSVSGTASQGLDIPYSGNPLITNKNPLI